MMTIAHMWVRFIERRKGELGLDRLKTGRARYKIKEYDAAQLIKSMIMTSMLRNAEKLRAALDMALKFLFDQRSQTYKLASAAMKAKYVVPSSSTLCKQQLPIHAAFMHRQRRVNKRRLERPFLWDAMFDASPQGFKDWLMHFGSTTPLCKLGKVFLMAHTLIVISLKGLSKPHDEEIAEADAARYLARIRQPLYLPPVALGSKRTSMPHKFHALAHAVHLVTMRAAVLFQILYLK